MKHLFHFSLPSLHLLIVSIFMLVIHPEAAAQCPQRYLDKVFPAVKTTKNISYAGKKTNTSGTPTSLAFDLYEPQNDTAQLRPLVVLIHGGAFTNSPSLLKGSPEIVELCQDLAIRGYVAISPEYRQYSGELTYDNMLEAVATSCFDMNELMCFLAASAGNGNPYRIDTSKVFMGGSSSGAVISLNFGLFVNDTSELKAELLDAVNKVADFDGVNARKLLENKFCGISPKGIISLSGGFIDTSYIKPVPGGAILAIHGVLDSAIPYMQGPGLGNPLLPVVYGPGIFGDNLVQAGIRYEADIYPDLGHVPVLLPLFKDLEFTLQQFFENLSLFNPVVMDSTKRHIASFCYDLIGRPETNCSPTGAQQYYIGGQLSISPNPSSGLFQVTLPQPLRNRQVKIQVFDASGRSIFKKKKKAGAVIELDIGGKPAGTYFLQISTSSGEGTLIYIDKLWVQN